MTKKLPYHFISLKAMLFSGMLLLYSFNAMCQIPVVNRGERIMLINGSFIHINGSYTSQSRAADPSGSLYYGGHFFGDTLTSLFVTDSIINNNEEGVNYGDPDITSMILSELEVVLTGNRKQVISGTTPIRFFKLTVDKIADSLKLDQDMYVKDTLELVQGNIHLNHHNISLTNTMDVGTGAISGEREAHRILDHRNGRGSIYTRLNEPENNQNLNGLGLFLERTGSLGWVNIRRGHGKQGGTGPADGGPGDGSILRYYQIEIEDKSIVQEIPLVKMTYLDAELDTLDESNLHFWSSQSSSSLGPGSVWSRFEGGNGDAAVNEFTVHNLFTDYTRFTLAPFTCTNPPVISFPSDTVFLCEGADTTLDAGNPGMIFYWSTTETTQQITVSDPGKYLLRVTDSKGCFSIDSIVVEIVNNPVASILDVIPVCLGDTTRLISTSVANEPGGLTYLWNSGTAVPQTSTAQDTAWVYPASGNFTATLEVTNYYGCKNSTTENVIISPVPVLSFTMDNACQGQAVVFNNTTMISSGTLSYEWNFGDGETADVLNPEHSYTTEGIYPVRLIAVSSGSMCRDTLEQPIEIFTSPQANYAYSGNCMNDPVTFTNTSSISSGALSYAWNFDDGTASLSTDPVKTFTTPGRYEVRLIASSSQGCTDTSSHGIIINNCDADCSVLAPDVNLGADRYLCDGEAALLDAGNTGSDYTWSEGSSAQSISVNSQGLYDVVVISPEGCVGYDEVYVNVTPNFTVNLGSDLVLCSVSGIVLSPILSRAGSYSYSWGSDQGVSGTSADLSVSAAGKYWITVNDLSGCGFFDRDTIEIRPTTNSIKAEFLVASTIVVGDPLEFVQLSHPDPVTYVWNFGDGTASMDQQPVHTFLVEGNYTVLLTVDNGVCSDTLSKLISVINPVIRPNINVLDSVNTNSQGITFVELPKPLVYPNPTEGAFIYELTLEKESTVDIQIYSLQGLMLSQRRVKGTSIRESYDLSGEGSGLYMIRTILNDQIVLNKIIKL